jgi:hypothetical protein
VHVTSGGEKIDISVTLSGLFIGLEITVNVKFVLHFLKKK